MKARKALGLLGITAEMIKIPCSVRYSLITCIVTHVIQEDVPKPRVIVLQLAATREKVMPQIETTKEVSNC